MYLRHLRHRETHFHLRHQGYGDPLDGCTRLLLIQPAELRRARPGEADGFRIDRTGTMGIPGALVATIPEARRCVEARTLVSLLVDIYEGKEGVPRAALEEWGPVRDECVASTAEAGGDGEDGGDGEGAGCEDDATMPERNE